MVADKIPKTNSQTLHTYGSSPLTLGQQLCSPGMTSISTVLLIFSLHSQPFSSSAMKLWTGSVGLQTTANFPSPLSVSPKPQLLQATASVLQGHPKSLGKGSRIQGSTKWWAGHWREIIPRILLPTSKPYKLSQEENNGNAFRKILHLNWESFRPTALPLWNWKSDGIKFSNCSLTPRMCLLSTGWQN